MARKREKGTWFPYGDFISPDIERRDARLDWLNCIGRNAPEVLKTLAKDVLPKYQAFIEGYDGPSPEPERCWQPETEKIAPSFAATKAALQDWAESYNLSPRHFEGALTGEESAWLLRQAFWTLYYWNKFPKHQRISFWTPAAVLDSPLSKAERKVSFELDYNPAFETRAEAEGRIMAEVKASLAGQLDIIEERMRQVGWRPVAAKKKLRRDFLWLVEYQVKGLSYYEIAQREGERGSVLAPDAIGKALNAVASLLGVKLRPHDPGGAPRKPLKQKKPRRFP